MKNSTKKLQLPEKSDQPEIEPNEEPNATPIPEELPWQDPPDENGENYPAPEINPQENEKIKKKSKYKVVLQERNVE